MKRWKTALAAIAVLLNLSAVPPASAFVIWEQCSTSSGTSTSDTKVCKASGDANEKNASTTIVKLINLLLFAIGVTAVVMVIWGGMKYVTSGGDPANVKSAKDTITYAVAGVIVALLAYAIVNFIVTIFQ